MNLLSVLNQLLISFTFSAILILGICIIEAHFQRIRKPLAIFYLLLAIYTGYAAIMEYQYYRNSFTTMAKVSTIRYTGNLERKATHSCGFLRGGRIDCTELYAYDLTWQIDGKSRNFHAEDKHIKPGFTMCVKVVKDRPAIGKPCENVFFNASHLPILIAIWAISGFIFATLLLYRLKKRRKLKHSTIGLYRIFTESQQLLLETRNWQDAMAFFSGRYRLRSKVKTVEEINIDGKREKVVCLNCFVRPRKKR